MGLFDRLLGKPSSNVKVAGQASSKPQEEQKTFFLDADASSTLGDVNFMRRSNTIRRTFPGNADSPGEKELVAEVASMEARVEKATPGLGGTSESDGLDVNLTGGVPKPVKKTFAQTMSSAELEQRMKGSAVAVNAPGATAGPARKIKAEEDEAKPGSTPQAGRPGSIDPFKAMARDINS
ncbi:MAG: hypothetical protein VKK62_09100 [Synechococcaceae cyanobacterium]|nr:hypothetical protein [Synechococcaceae cyanobacterium]